MTTMYDSVDVSQIPANAEAVAGYVGGSWPTYNEIVKKFPKAHHLSIAVNASENAECLDIESGDAVAGDAPAWFHRQIKLGVKVPCFYTSLSNINALHQILENAGISRTQYRIWSAHYTGKPHICGPSEGLNTTADGTQYWDKGLGKNLDVSLVDANFFGVTPPKPDTWMPGDEHNWEVEWDRIVGKTELRYHLRRLYLRARMLQRRREITKAAKKTGWHVENRLYRYEQLQKRSK